MQVTLSKDNFPLTIEDRDRHRGVHDMGEIGWHLVCKVQEIGSEDAMRFEIDGKVYAIFHTPSGYYATDGLCTHEQANLADGFISGDYVSCPKHNSRFHIPTGKAMRIPAKIDLRTYLLKIEDEKVWIGLPF
jgi:3-phenylpropionate/trans-cinnamate dioxygenase ferredoxin subunit